MTRTFQTVARDLAEVVRQNVMMLGLGAFFVYWTFYAGRLNVALVVLVTALALMIVCRVVYHFSATPAIRLTYRLLLLLCAGLLFTALCIQTVRFIAVFVPTLTAEPTLSRILVRVGIISLVLYAYAVPLAFVYYLYAHNMTQLLWKGSLDRILQTAFLSNRRTTTQRVRHANALFTRVVVWGGLATAAALGVGLVAWLLR